MDKKRGWIGSGSEASSGIPRGSFTRVIIAAITGPRGCHPGLQTMGLPTESYYVLLMTRFIYDIHGVYTAYTRRIPDAWLDLKQDGPGGFITEIIESTPAFLNFVTERLLKIRLSTMRRDVFQAIADPTRREIINLLAHQALNLNAIADNFDISRPAVSKHIRILTECGLLMITQQGRERYCKANLQKLQEVAEWTEQFKSFWMQKLDALEDFLEKEKKESGKK